MLIPLCNPSLSIQSAPISVKPNKTIISITNSASSNNRVSTQRRTISAFEARISLIFALASQSFSLSQRRKFVADVATETAKYLFPKRFESRTLEEALMTVPDLETVNFKVLTIRDQYEIREIEPYFVAETTMPGKSGFDFRGSSQSFNVLAEYLFGKNTKKEKMEMTTPVFTTKKQSDGVKMDMTTPVLTTKTVDKDEWKMSFVMPSKYGANLPLPKDSSVAIKEVARKTVAVVSFSGFVNDEEVKRRELKLREALKNDGQFKIKEGTSIEIAQYNPPFALPFQRRNEIALEVEWKNK
ncbi:heme-binding-like protein At3g10130, chloroplastic isoform X1 [Medicago truncatula]|uniref:heme-binding-like protein At3g10130, chloroplastic isoform X1 n=1 Tax=Medicago truncatula TaxID=3880 RepID=UPI00196840A1|nr:heme-binding-like protein At3g10130, chloroplastic isoform X1 [Medicago truncatula]XP_039683621.1 heme-binding-like protein At3g10130, chloroplastic isoform X1 [Medicago truncatula]XP_039683622.1 heme-binding-like protein At3g10130, chloroplastic isoform X1 [Medicago truncatula]